MTRNGKIARLPHFIREELNQRLFDGEPGVKLIEWVHEQDVVWEVLEENGFDPITEQNLSEWKNGGYQSWVDNREARELVMRMTSRADDLGESVEGANLGDCVATLLMVELMKVARVLVQQEEDPEKRWKEMRRVGRELSRHRRDRARDIRIDINQKRCDWAEEDREEVKEEKHAEWVKQQRLAEYRLRPVVAMRASGHKKKNYEAAWSLAAREIEIEHGLPKGLLDREHKEGYWLWEEDDEQWHWWRRDARAADKEEGRVKNEEGKKSKRAKGKGRKHPSTKRQAPEKHQKPSSKGKVRSARASGKAPKSKHQAPEKHQSSSSKVVEGSTESRPTCSEPSGDGSSVASPHHEGGGSVVPQRKIEDEDENEEEGTAREDSRPAGTQPNPTESDQIQPFNE